MMTRDEFHNALRILRSIDAHELGDPEWWPSFARDPYYFFIARDEAHERLDRDMGWGRW